MYCSILNSSKKFTVILSYLTFTCSPWIYQTADQKALITFTPSFVQQTVDLILNPSFIQQTVDLILNPFSQQTIDLILTPAFNKKTVNFNSCFYLAHCWLNFLICLYSANSSLNFEFSLYSANYWLNFESCLYSAKYWLNFDSCVQLEDCLISLLLSFSRLVLWYSIKTKTQLWAFQFNFHKIDTANNNFYNQHYIVFKLVLHLIFHLRFKHVKYHQ